MQVAQYIAPLGGRSSVGGFLSGMYVIILLFLLIPLDSRFESAPRASYSLQPWSSWGGSNLESLGPRCNNLKKISGTSDCLVH